ncbi:hypothetical protein MELA_02109 [Candidatus Methylomirabilis lanthanidiphila]|uniref:Uncharacterized protein n=1 Tax=Candidatus Methylomirabilis lanthanidiphila TaxID=2211376 RepID=A0A564ZKA0_9BACT|nr:hypothetical protein MELA_02109 [Candidatus Methylomirabilis lanthanidiphila]
MNSTASWTRTPVKLLHISVIVLNVFRVIAKRSRSNLTVLQDNDGEIAALPSVARNDQPLTTLTWTVMMLITRGALNRLHSCTASQATSPFVKGGMQGILGSGVIIRSDNKDKQLHIRRIP